MPQGRDSKLIGTYSKFFKATCVTLPTFQPRRYAKYLAFFKCRATSPNIKKPDANRCVLTVIWKSVANETIIYGEKKKAGRVD